MSEIINTLLADTRILLYETTHTLFFLVNQIFYWSQSYYVYPRNKVSLEGTKKFTTRTQVTKNYKRNASIRLQTKEKSHF